MNLKNIFQSWKDDEEIGKRKCSRRTTANTNRSKSYDAATIQAALNMIKRGISRKEIEKRLNVPQSTLHGWIND